jgi:hypothetical protein
MMKIAVTQRIYLGGMTPTVSSKLTNQNGRSEMNISQTVNRSKLLLGAGAALCALLNSSAFALPSILDTAVNPANGHTYYLLDNSDWTDAANKAITLGGNLVTVNDLAENLWVWNQWGANRDLWIGLFDPILGDGSGAQHASDFRWVSQDLSAYRNWRAGEPNNGNTGEYNAYILAQSLAVGQGVWNDGPNVPSLAGEPLLYGVVEVVPEPSSVLLLAGGALIAFSAKRRGGVRRKTN